MAEHNSSNSSVGDGAPAVLYEKRGTIAWVTLNRPDKFNAYNVAMRDALFEILGAIHDDAEIRAMVLIGRLQGVFHRR